MVNRDVPPHDKKAYSILPFLPRPHPQDSSSQVVSFGPGSPPFSDHLAQMLHFKIINCRRTVYVNHPPTLSKILLVFMWGILCTSFDIAA